MKTLETPRLILRPYTPDDADFVLDLYSRLEVQRYIGTTPKLMKDKEEAHARIEAWTRLDDGTCGVWAVQERAVQDSAAQERAAQDSAASGRLVGTLLLKPIPASGPEPVPSGDIEIGWHLHPRFWGRGYASEAGAAVLARAFSAGLPRVVAVTNPANMASQRVCVKVGLKPEGSTDRYYNTVCALFSADNPGSA